MLNIFLYIMAFVGGGLGIYFVFRKLQQEDRAILAKTHNQAHMEYRRQIWLGGIVRHSIFALATVAAGGGLAVLNEVLQERESSRYSEDLYYLSGGLILLGIFWLIIIAVKYAKENKQWQNPTSGT